MKKDHDYSIFLYFIFLWLMIGSLAQCESARNLDGIKHELRMLRLK